MSLLDSSPPHSAPAAGRRAFPSPLRLAVAAALAAAVFELIIMRLNPLLPEGHPWHVGIFDAVALALLLAPSLYYLLFRPLSRNIATCRQAAAKVAEGGHTLAEGLGAVVAMPSCMSPWRLTLFTAAVTFGAETLVMRLVPTLSEVHPWPVAIIDSALLVVLLTPALYLVLFRPLTQAIQESRRTADWLRRAMTESERALRERSAELAAANERLTSEVEERRRAEQALRAGEEMYRSLVETMSEGLCVVDEDSRITYVNDKLLEMTGYSKGEMIGLRTEHFVDEDGRRIVEEQRARRRRGDRDPYEIPLVARDGHRVDVLVSPRAVFDGAGRFTGSFAVVTDITELKRKEEKLTQWRTYLQALSGQLMAAQEQERARIARELHDGLGQTLTAIKFLIEGACAGPLNRNVEANRQLDVTVRKLQEAVEEVRRICMALRPAVLDDLGIVATVQWFCREFRAVFPAIEVRMRLEIEEGEIPEALKTVIFRVLQEAMNNAGKHSRADRILISLEKEEGTISFRVEDDGAGFDVERVLALRSQERRFGLDSMRERTLLSGGQFWIESTQGSGTTVRATWQLSELQGIDLAVRQAVGWTAYGNRRNGG